jgi:hypothetical protein
MIDTALAGSVVDVVVVVVGVVVELATIRPVPATLAEQPASTTAMPSVQAPDVQACQVRAPRL